MNKQQIDSNQELNEIQLMAKIKIILQKTRSIIKVVNKSNVIFSHVKKIIIRDRVRLPCLALDMPIRWNSTFLMIKNFKRYREYVNMITKHPQEIERLDTKMLSKLESFTFSQLDWELLDLLEEILQSFFLSTVLVSARNYATLAISYFVQANIDYYLNNESTHKHMLYQGFIKRRLLEQFTNYFDKKVTKAQKEKAQISAYLDPAIFNEIPDSEQPLIQQKTLLSLKKYYEERVSAQNPAEDVNIGEKAKSLLTEETTKKMAYKL
jgi:hypothetical protein